MVIEDERSIADTVVHCIEREGYNAVWHTEGLKALEAVAREEYALLVLDVGLPDISGFELCKAIRRFSAVPVIFLTARDEEIDKIVGLEIGGDDYVTKPFSPRELGARIKSVLRRSGGDELASVMPPSRARPARDAQDGFTARTRAAGAPEAVSAGTVSGQGRPEGGIALRLVHIDPDKMQAAYQGKALELTRYEFKLLALLARHPGRVFSRELLMERVWDSDSQSLDRTVDAHVKSLRAKFREIDAGLDPIITHRGTGYALRDDI
ncbi:response regulator [Desulfovibrio sp. OttesenSCG-928-A18]|nr:response regulator [Desulfovibrio sp. OttesenSCG-928-A18]